MCLLTGRFPLRWGMQQKIVDGHNLVGLPREQDLLPEMLRRAGYAHDLATGKWHVGHNYSRNHPIRQGFDSFYGNYFGALHYYVHTWLGELDWHRDFMDVPGDTGRYHTELITDEALAFIDNHANDPHPFFLYLPYLAGHIPQEAPQPVVQHYLDLLACDPLDPACIEKATHWAQVTVMDEQIGRILDRLGELQIANKTL